MSIAIASLHKGSKEKAHNTMDGFGSFPRSDAIYKSADMERAFDMLAVFYMQLLEGDGANVDRAIGLIEHYEVADRIGHIQETIDGDS